MQGSFPRVQQPSRSKEVFLKYNSLHEVQQPSENTPPLGFEQTTSFPCGNRAVVARVLGSRGHQKHHNVRCVFSEDYEEFCFARVK
jgi:hypothetical protein